MSKTKRELAEDIYDKLDVLYAVEDNESLFEALFEAREQIIVVIRAYIRQNCTKATNCTNCTD